MKGCADKAIALMIAGRRQWQRESKGCTDDALTLMKGCADEALALVIARDEGSGKGSQKDALTRLFH